MMDKKRYYILLFIVVLFAGSKSWAQQLSQTITGKIIDAQTQTAMDFASVALLHTDSTLIDGTYTDTKGKFILTLTEKDSALIKITYLGYESLILPVPFSEEKATVQMGTLELKPFSSELETVVIAAEKENMYEFKKDSIVFNVPEDFLTGGTAMDVLEYTPALTLDANNNIMVKGKGNVKVYVDSKPIAYTGMDVGSFLENTPSFMIEKVEILETPPDPEDAAKALAAGVTDRYYLNIITRKIRYRGYNAALTGGLNSRKEVIGRMRFNMNLKPFQLNYYNNLRNRTDSSYLHRTSFLKGNDSSVLDQRNYSTNLNFSQNLNAQYEFQFTEKENLRLKMNTGWNEDKQQSTHVSKLDNPKEINNQERIQKSDRHSNGYRISTNADYRKEYDKEFKELRATFDFSQNSRQNNNTSVGAYLLRGDTLNQLNKGNSRNMNLRGSLRYKNTFGNEKFYMLTGSMNLSKRHNLNDVSRSDTTSPLNEMHHNLRLSSDYRTSASNYSVLGIIGKRDKKLGWVAAVNAGYYMQEGADNYQHSDFNNRAFISHNAIGMNYGPGEDQKLTVHFNPGFEIYTQQTRANDTVPVLTYQYTNFTPGASAKYAFGDHEVSLGYNRNIRRPEWDQLNPFVDNRDPLNIRKGNPELRPEFTNKYNLRYKYNHKSVYASLDLGKDVSKDVISGYRMVDSNGISTRTYVNLNKRTTTDASLHVGMHYFKDLPGLKGNLNINTGAGLSAYQMQSDDEHVSKDFRHVSGITGNFKLWTSLRVGFLSLIVNGRYNGPRYFSQGKRPSRFGSGLRTRADFFKRTLNITLGIENLFGASVKDAYYKTDKYVQYSNNRHNVRYFSLYVTYKFRKYNKLGKESK